MSAHLYKKDTSGLRAVIFDMDGLLIDSEDFWRKAESAIYQEIGVPITEEMVPETMGMRIDEAVEYWFARYPWGTPSKKELEERMIKRVLQYIETQGKEKMGVPHIIKLFASRGIPMAIASSSAQAIIQAVMNKLELHPFISIAHSAEHELFGKPHPGVYITAAQRLGIAPEQCLAFEDSANGLLAAKAAKMKCVAIPDPRTERDGRFGIADLILSSLADFRWRHIKELYG